MKSFSRLPALLVAVVLVVAACGGDDDGDGRAGPTENAAAVAAEEPGSVETADSDGDHDHGHGVVVSDASPDVDAAFDLVATSVRVDDGVAVFRSQVVGSAGSQVPDAVGALDQAQVWSYVWPTTLDSSVVGFDEAQGILALAATSHPDFDDTPLYDEDADGDALNDGALWHSHWVVLVETPDCDGGLSVRDIPEGENPAVPATWPELPILIDSPDMATVVEADAVEIRVDLSDIGGNDDFGFDGVTSGLRVSTSPHDPLLCVEVVFDVASGDLSLPGKVNQ